MPDTKTLWNNYVLKKNIGSITANRAESVLSSCGYFPPFNSNPCYRIEGTRFYDTHSERTVNRVDKICKDFIKTLS